MTAALPGERPPGAPAGPRGRHQIVVSASVLAALSPAQLRAVPAHERAHLRLRHHVILALATSLAGAFPACRCSARPSRSLPYWQRWQPTMRPPAATAATTWPPRWSSWPPLAPGPPRWPPADPKPLSVCSESSLRSNLAPGLPGWQPSPGSSRLWSSRAFRCSLPYATSPVILSGHPAVSELSASRSLNASQD
jgi:Peptidase family M48